jgi:SIR2-like domain/NACHT domain/HEAT repeats
MPPPSELRQTVRDLVDAGATTQKGLAELAGIDPAQMSRFMARTDDRGLSEEKLRALADAVQSVRPAHRPVLPEKHVETLAHKLRDGQLALFVGAGLSHLAPRKDGGPQRLPLWDGLRQAIAGRFFPDDPDLYTNPLDLFDAIVLDHDRDKLNAAIKEVLDDEPYELSEAHQRLRKLPWTALLTSNYDGLLGRGHPNKPIITDDDFYSEEWRRDLQHLIHVHGSLGNPHSLTRDDYRRWPVKHERAYHYLKDLLLNHTVLFVGYSLSDPHIEHLLEEVREILKGRDKRLFAWLWRIKPPQQRLLEKRDKIDAVSIDQEADWARAFRELALAHERLRKEAPDRLRIEAFPDDFDSPYDRAQYAQAVRSRYGPANLSGLYVAGPGYAREDILLEEVFVMPDLEPLESSGQLHSRPGSTVDEMLKSYFRSQMPGDLSPRPDAVADEPELEQARRSELRQATDRVLRQPADSLRQRAIRLLIVGDPGQGKTTLLFWWLLQTVAAWQEHPHEHPLPIYLRLSLWEGGMEGGDARLLTYLRRTLPDLCEADSRAVEAWTKRPVLWLLDGLDEIRDPLERRRLREEVRSVADQRPNDRWVLASRPSADPTEGLGAGWEMARLSPLSDPQILNILKKWAEVLLKKENLAFNYRQLNEAFKKDPGLNRLRGNGLLLTLAVLFYKANLRLPHDRWEFYEHADRTLRDSWLRRRMGERVRKKLPGPYLPDLLGELALQGMLQGKTTFSGTDLETLAGPFLKVHGYEGDARKLELARLRSAAEDLIGVLVARGVDRFGFLHLTFQEYHAARALFNKGDAAKEIIARFWDHPDWAEVWPLYVLSGKDREGHVDTLDRHLHRPETMCLRLAGVGRRPLPERSPVWSSILTWAEESLRPKENGWRELACLRTLRRWEKPIPASLHKSLLAALKDGEWVVRQGAAGALAGAVAEAEVRAALLAALQDSEWYVRQATATSLIKGVESARHGKGRPPKRP